MEEFYIRRKVRCDTTRTEGDMIIIQLALYKSYRSLQSQFMWRFLEIGKSGMKKKRWWRKKLHI